VTMQQPDGTSKVFMVPTEMLSQLQQQRQGQTPYQHPPSTQAARRMPPLSEQSRAANITLALGQRVRVTVIAHSRLCDGTVRYVGETGFKPGEWVGVQLDEPIGKHDGSVNGQLYFKCPDRFGLFTRPDKVEVLRERPISIWEEWQALSQHVDGRCGHARDGSAMTPVVVARRDGDMRPGATDERIAPRVSTSAVVGTAADGTSTSPASPSSYAAGKRAGDQRTAETETGEGASNSVNTDHTTGNDGSEGDGGESQGGDGAADASERLEHDSSASVNGSNRSGHHGDTRAGRRGATVIILGGEHGPHGVMSQHFTALSRSTGQASSSDGNRNLLQQVLQSVSTGNIMQSVSSGLQFLINGGAATTTQATDINRPRLGDRVTVVKAGDAHGGMVAQVVQDDHDSQPFRLLFEDNSLSNTFYRESEVTLLERGSRPFKGDRVRIIKENDPHHGESAQVVVDDFDAQPYRLQFQDGSISHVYYRVADVSLIVSSQPALPAIASSTAADSYGSAHGQHSAEGSRTGIEAPSPDSTDSQDAEVHRGEGRARLAIATATHSPLRWLKLALRRREDAARAPRSLSEAIFAQMAMHEVAQMA